LSFLGNAYFAAVGQGWFEWGVTWDRHKSYSNLADFQNDLGMDRDGRVLDPNFANLNGLDFRLEPATMEQLKQNYPQDDVPGVILGAK
jgi:hypothetical protein